MNLSVLMKNKALKAFFPFHDEERRTRLFSMWVTRYAAPSAQPLDQVKVGTGAEPCMFNDWGAGLSPFVVWMYIRSPVLYRSYPIFYIRIATLGFPYEFVTFPAYVLWFYFCFGVM